MSKATGRIVYVPPPDTSHKCNPPVGWRKPVQGTVWRCDDCRKFWEWNWHTPDAWVGRSGEWVTSLGSWFELPDDYKPPVVVPPDRKGVVYGRGKVPTKPPFPASTGKPDSPTFEPRSDAEILQMLTPAPTGKEEKSK